MTARDTQKEIDEFDSWLEHLPYRKKIFIAGNHDNLLVDEIPRKYLLIIRSKRTERLEYLCDSGTEFEGLKIWGSPWSSQFPGINPKCCAFTYPFMDSIQDKWDLIPDDTDILVTHTPPFGFFDKIKTEHDAHVGDMNLRDQVIGRIKPKLHAFSHIHECGGSKIDTNVTQFVNCSIMNEKYRPVNKPVRIILPES